MFNVCVFHRRFPENVLLKFSRIVRCRFVFEIFALYYYQNNFNAFKMCYNCSENVFMRVILNFQFEEFYFFIFVQ